MSLIEDALRKHQQEAEKVPAPAEAQPPAEPPSPPEPPPLPPSSEPPAEPAVPASRNWPLLAGIVALVVLLIAAAGALGFLAYQQWVRAKAAVAPAAGPAPSPRPLPAATTLVTQVSGAASPSSVLASVSVTGATATAVVSSLPAITAAVDRAAVTSDNRAVASDVSVKPATTGAKAEAVQTARVMAVSAPAPKPPVIWPKLKLSGFLNVRGSGASRGTAIINGQMVSEGETIEDVKLISMSQGEVLLELQGERRTLKVGESLR